jgi:hypothetical protein
MTKTIHTNSQRRMDPCANCLMTEAIKRKNTPPTPRTDVVEINDDDNDIWSES